MIGDSSLYTKRNNNKKKSYISSVLREKYRFVNLTERIFPGGGVLDLQAYLQDGPEFDVLGVSYFGNEHTKGRMDVKIQRDLWKDVFRLLSRKVRSRVVFFVGGYAEKYTFGKVYDDNLNIVKRWIRDAGFQVVEARQEVSCWQLAADKLHFAVDCLPELAAFWNQLLQPRKFVRPGKLQTAKRKSEADAAQMEPKRARKDPRDKWLLPAPQNRRDFQQRPVNWSDLNSDSSDDWTKGQERAARLERDKKKLNDELAMRRTMMLKARGLLPAEPKKEPRHVPPRRL